MGGGGVTPCLDVGWLACLDPRRGWPLPSAQASDGALIVGFGERRACGFRAATNRLGFDVYVHVADDYSHKRTLVSCMGKPVGSRT